MTFKCLNGLAPSYLSDLATRNIPRRNLRSANSHRLLDVRYKLRNYGFRSFSLASLQFYTMWMVRALWLVVAHDLSEYRNTDDVTGNLFSCEIISD